MTLKDVANWSSGGTPKAGTTQYYGGDIPWAVIGDLNDGHVSTTASTITEAGLANSSAKIVPPGTLLVGMYGSIGKLGIADVPMATNQAIACAVPASDLHLSYLFHYLRSQREALLHAGKGGAQQNISQTVLKAWPIPVPPLDEQRRIAAYLDEIDARRSSIAHLLATARAIIDRLRAAVVAAACSGRLTADWRKDQADIGRAETEQLGSESEGPFEVPSTWAWSSLDSITEIRGGIQVGAKVKTTATREVPYLRVANVQRGWLDLSEIKTILAPEDKIASLRLQPGDIFFNEGGDRDKLGRGWVWEGQIDECIHQNHVFRARLHDKTFEPRFFSWYGNTFGPRYFFDEGRQTVNLASLSRKRLGLLPVPVPPADEQAEIARRVIGALTIADRLGEVISAAAAATDGAIRGALAQAFRAEPIFGDDDGR